MQFKDILYEVKDDYAHVTINRPKVLNAFTPVTLHELKNALDSAEKDGLKADFFFYFIIKELGK